MALSKQPMPKEDTAKVIELDKKRLAVRGIILLAIGSILAVKTYLIFFIVTEFFTGLYMILTTKVLLFYLVSAWVKYKDPWAESKFKYLPEYRPLVSIIIPVKNGEFEIRDSVQSCIDANYSNKEIIVVDDGSTDKTPQILDEMKRNSNVKVIHLVKNVGKKKAVEKAMNVAKGEIFVGMDSDIIMDSEAVPRTVKIFSNDPNLGALVGHGRVNAAESGNWLEKIQDVWYDGQNRLIKGCESGYYSCSCCSGSYSAFRREAVKPFVHAWANDKFFGQEFIFATDRLMTAIILGYRPKVNLEPKLDKTATNVSASNNFREGDDYTGPRHWNIRYSSSVRIKIGVPTNFTSFLKQQIRWRKSFIRSIFSTGSVYWKRPFPMNIVFYVVMALKIVRPLVLLHAFVLLPLAGDYTTPFFYMASVFFTGMIYGVDFRLRNKGETLWLYRPLVTILSSFILTWLLPIALLQIRTRSWR